MTATEGTSRPFSAGDIEDAARDFRLAVDDLRRAGLNLWDTRLDALVHLWRTNHVLSQVMQPLRQNPFDPQLWLERRREETGPAGHARELRLPPDRAEAATVMLRLLEWVADNPTPGLAFDTRQVVVGVRNNRDQQAQEASEVMLQPLRRYVDAELDALLRAARSARPVAAGGGDTHHHTYTGSVGVLAPGASFNHSPITVTQHTTYEATSDLGRTLLTWKDAMEDVAEDQRGAVRLALELLARRADERNLGNSAEVVQAAETVVQASPTLRARVDEWLKKAPGAAATGVVTGAAGAVGKSLVENHDVVAQFLQHAFSLARLTGGAT